MVELNGFEELQHQLTQAQEAAAELDGNIGEINFDPEDVASVESAIAKMELMIDSKVACYIGNPIVEELANEMKDKYRVMILDRTGATSA